MQIFRRAAAQRVEARAVQRRVVAGKFHRAAEPVARAPRRDADGALLQHERNPRTERRPRKRDRVALAGLDRQSKSGLLRQRRRPRAEREHDLASGKISAARTHARDARAVALDRIDARALLDHAAFRAHEPRQRIDITIGPEVRIARIEIAGDDAGLQCRFHRMHVRRIERLDRQIDLGQRARQPARVLEVGLVAEHVQRAARFELAIERLRAHEILDQPARVHQQRSLRARRGAEIGPVAAARETEQPAPQREVEARRDAQRRIRTQHRAQRRADHARHRKRRRVARRQRAAVAVRAAAAGRTLLQHGHAATRFEQVMRAGEADHAAAENQHIGIARLRHRRHDAQCDGAAAKPGPVTKRPGFAPVGWPPCTISTPLTTTSPTPVANWRGLSKVAWSMIVAGSNTTTSAK